jgi:hypothetical protein
MNGDDVGVTQASEDLRFSLEANAARIVTQAAPVHYLDRDFAARAELDAVEDGSLAAAADFCADRIPGGQFLVQA